MTLSFQHAPLWKRLFSTIYDFLILCALSLAYFGVATAVSTLVLGNQAVEFRPNARGLWVQAGWLITLLGFYCYFWLRIGQTVAMKAWRLKLIKDGNQPLTIGICIVRCILGMLSLALCGLGYFWIWVDKDKKALHDRLTRTSVVILDREQS